MQKTLSDWAKNPPIVIFSHNPLYEYYPPWNFWVRDWRQVNEVLRPYTKVTNIHGHVHQVLYTVKGYEYEKHCYLLLDDSDFDSVRR